MGLDLGKRRDPAAIAVVESGERKLGVRQLERIALGTPYPLVVERVREIVRASGNCAGAVRGWWWMRRAWATPVVDLLRQARLGCEICAVTITSGEHVADACVVGRRREAGMCLSRI